jgi:hypothetical protein
MGYIVLENKKISFDEISSLVPFVMINALKIHIDICEFIVSHFYSFSKKSIEKKVLVNLLCNKSTKAKFITAIVLLSKKEKIISIESDYISNDFQDFFDYEIKFTCKNKTNINFIDRSEIKTVILKYFVNIIYRLIRNPFIKPKSHVIRTWVDVDEKIYKNLFNSGVIYIYPFPMNIIRGLRYIKNTFLNYKNVSLMGVPYSLKDLAMVIFGGKKDLKILKFEINGHAAHSKDFKNYEKIYTSDEYISAVYALYENLKHKDIINTAHGVGLYNPYINYNKFFTINEYQMKYYFYKNRKINFEIFDEQKSSYQIDSTLKSCIVIIDQGDLSKKGFIYESNLQKKLNQKIIEIKKQTSIEVFVKFHPNRTESEKKKFSKQFDIKEIKNVSRINNINIFFVNLYSGAYYDFIDKGYFIFIYDDFFDPKVFFGDKINSYHIDNINDKIIQTLDINGY